MAIKVWNASGLTGGSAGKLDSFAVGTLTTGDRAHVVDGGKFYFYVYDSTATAAENSPLVIRPDSYVSGGNWVLAASPYGDLAIMPEVVSGLPLEGNISGGDISRASNTTLTITPISCLDSGQTTKLYTSHNTTFTVPHTGSIAANTIYNIFLVKLASGGTFEFRSYPTEAAVASDAAVSKHRWVGFWLTNGSSQLCIGLQISDLFIFGKASETVITGSLTTSFATYSHAAIVPASRIREIMYGVNGTAGTVSGSLDGTNIESFVGYSGGAEADTSSAAWGSLAHTGDGFMPFLATRQFKSSDAGTDLLVHKVRVRR